jgi:hypothetical protein
VVGNKINIYGKILFIILRHLGDYTYWCTHHTHITRPRVRITLIGARTTPTSQGRVSVLHLLVHAPHPHHKAVCPYYTYWCTHHTHITRPCVRITLISALTTPTSQGCVSVLHLLVHALHPHHKAVCPLFCYCRLRTIKHYDSGIIGVSSRLGYDAILISKYLPTFRRRSLPPFQGLSSRHFLDYSSIWNEIYLCI